MPQTTCFTTALRVLLAGIFLATMTTCKKRADEAPSVVTNVISNITHATAYGGGTVSSEGTSSVTSRGICWSTASNPGISDAHTSDGNGAGSFTSSMAGLSPNTIYYVRAYATNGTGTAYGNLVSFTTTFDGTGLTVATSAIANITKTTATSGGIVVLQGNMPVTSRGVCWATSSNPTIADAHSSDGSGTGGFTSNITGLAEVTRYYVRAYATNSEGTTYGNELNFRTAGIGLPPSVFTDSVTNITTTGATAGGKVSSQGSSPVTARGVCWSTSSLPTTAGTHSSDGSGTGVFASNIEGLTTNTPYFVRAYATNIYGTTYGIQAGFVTTGSGGFLPCTTVPTLIYEGKTYNTIQIGTQCWLKENLNVGTRINGSVNQSSNGIIEKYCYDDLESNCDIYGGLYQWNEMQLYSTKAGIKGICPTGWHIPWNAEWTKLTTFLGGDTIAGGKMKSTTGWEGDGNGTNFSGFTALPGGAMNGIGLFSSINSETSYWTSTQNTNYNDAWYRNLNTTEQVYGSENAPKSFGFSVRCLKN